MYSMMKRASMLKDYRQCPETLAGAPESKGRSRSSPSSADRSAPSSWKKQKEPVLPREPEPDLSEERDPLANLKRLEENRPGFTGGGHKT